MKVQNNTRMKLSVSLAVLLLMMVGPCVGCTSGNVRLTNSSNGTLQICKNEWRTVCTRGWGNLDTAVACRQLEYDGGYTQSTYTRVIVPVDPVYYHCNGSENKLQDCEMQAGSSCSYGVTIVCVRRNVSDPCNSGDIRLWGGESEYEGNIELYTDHGVWSAVSHYRWDNADAVVACRQLGYSGSVAVPYLSSAFGQRFQPMEFGGLDCRGNETSLHECSVYSRFVKSESSYNHRSYSGVRCIPKGTATCKNGDVRLADGYSDNNGFAEICIDGIWIGICLQQYSTATTITSHICNGLGYPRFTKIQQSFFTANRSQPQAYVYLDEYARGCRVESPALLDCVHNSSSYGVLYRTPCSTDGILCCPNDTAKCCFQPRSPMDPITPTQTTPTTSTDVHTTGEDRAEFSLDFGTAATSLIMSSAGDLRGLEEDIQNRVIDDISSKCNCSFDKSALKDGYFTFGESVTYHSKVLGVAGQPAISLVTMLKECIEDNPLIHYHEANIYLAATFKSVYCRCGRDKHYI